MPRRAHTRRDLASAAGLATLSVMYLLSNRAYPLDSLATPGPGVFPLAVGLLIFGLAVAQAVVAVRSRAADETAAAPAIDAGAFAGRRVLVLTALLVAYAAAAGIIGFLSSSFAVIVLSSRLLGARDWLRPLALALVVTVAAYVIFVAWLGVPFPRGLLR